MKEKLTTGLILLAVFVALIWINNFVLNFLIFAAMLVCAFFESVKIYKLKKESRYLVLVALGFFAVMPFLTLEEPFSASIKLSVLMVISVASIIAFAKYPTMKILLPFIYPCVPIFIMFGLYSDLGIFYFVWMIFIVIASDSGAYFVGKAFGRIEFSKSSPNKTLEGVIGGFVFALVVSFIYAKIFTNLEVKEILATTIVISVFGVFGDLFESYLKRRANVKDSGTIFPGHGGVLDRIDGYMFGAIAMFLIYSW